MSIDKDKLYTKHDLEQIQRIAIIETKLDNLQNTVNTKCDDINNTLKTIRAHQTKPMSLKDIVSYSKKNYKIIIPLILFLVGGDAIRSQIINWLINPFINNSSKAQDISNALNK